MNDNNLATVPEQIGLQQMLKILDLSYNQLDSLPQGFGVLHNLQRLELSHNGLLSLPDTIGKLETLQILNIQSDTIKKQEFTQFLKSCTKPVKLTTDDDAYNNDPGFLLIVVDKIEPEWLELPNVELYKR